ncbi:ribonuclease VapC32 [Actinomycetospora sp. NBRC 106375]|uniref:PIN domain-containing protein n=1 Tax=Actinomycetospora sp. NBRC 106375 TaxID=3032207 RepID=UPI00249FBED9|nr:PIN domain-containing protein [Actinomycetospora sp. NBRC 106375]GLZ46778.1 ribonuclease VapC32 [Actinomycetospora sp. NBRC 106375]
MILVDTSVWIDHLHRTEPALSRLLGDDVVATHDGIVEEIALGSIARRDATLSLLRALIRAPRLRHDELLSLVDRDRLWGRGLSVIDVQLLGAARLARAALWTRDERLLAAAADRGVDVFDESS